MKISVVEKILTDSSSVFDVYLIEDGDTIVIPALGEKCAHRMAEQLKNTINENACMDVELS